MDITVLFKACVNAIETRNRAFGDLNENERVKILQPVRRKCEFSIRSREIIKQITRLRDFISKNKKGYLNFSNYIYDWPEMSDEDRDKIDAGAQAVITACSGFINELEKETVMVRGSQTSEHKKAILHLLKDYLKEASKSYYEQKALRIERSAKMQKMLRLDRMSPKKEKDPKAKRKPAPITIPEPRAFEKEPLSPDEIQMFEKENTQLYAELNSLSDEIDQIENKVVKIAELQDIFTEKILEQDKDIDRIAATIIGTTENVKDANEEIRRAIQRNAGFRVWILFFLLVMSFTLLFLDWYND